MAGHDFDVDLEALLTAATRSSELVELKRDMDVNDYVPTEAALACDTVWSAVDEFQDRWERGINARTDDISEVSGRLAKVAANYAEYVQRSAETMAHLRGIMASLPQRPLAGE